MMQARKRSSRSAGVKAISVAVQRAGRLGAVSRSTHQWVTLTEPQIGRLSLYRRQLQERSPQAPATIFSHDLASLCGITAAQVRRDLMTIGFVGSPARGYEVAQLIEAITRYLDAPGGQSAVLVGVGNLGRAILDYFAARHPNLTIVAGFDTDPQKTDRVLHGVRIHDLARLAAIVSDHKVTVGVIAVPASVAQQTADALLAAGVRAFLNFAPVPLRLPPQTYVEDMDITTSMEKAAFFGRVLAAGTTISEESHDD
jgi:redox-sensing transcriptional repressor